MYGNRVLGPLLLLHIHTGEVGFQKHDEPADHIGPHLKTMYSDPRTVGLVRTLLHIQLISTYRDASFDL